MAPVVKFTLSHLPADNMDMDIQTLSTNMSQNRIMEEAALKVQGMVMSNIKDAAADLGKLMDSAKVITDTNAGNFLNVFM